MPAMDLYRSPWFIKARAWVKRRMKPEDRWFILSAEHELLEPDAVIAPYENTLNGMSSERRKAWAKRVLRQLLPWVSKGSHIVILAGKLYREHLVNVLTDTGAEVTVPMTGLGIGKQLHWLSK